jgi:hypothetical protein
MRTIAYVDLEPSDQGTRVHATLRSHPFIAAFMTVWIAMVAAFNIVILALVLGGATHPWNLVFPLLMLIFGFAFIGFGRWLVRSERAALLDYIGVVISPP